MKDNLITLSYPSFTGETFFIEHNDENESKNVPILASINEFIVTSEKQEGVWRRNTFWYNKLSQIFQEILNMLESLEANQSQSSTNKRKLYEVC